MNFLIKYKLKCLNTGCIKIVKYEQYKNHVLQECENRGPHLKVIKLSQDLESAQHLIT